jgi:hypothetical protein
VKRGRLVGFLLAPLLGVLLAGCGEKQKANARITGVVEVCGAPLLNESYSCRPQSGAVSVLGPRGKPVAYERLSRSRYSFRLSPGTYELVARNGGNGPWKHPAKAESGRTTVVNFVITAI